MSGEQVFPQLYLPRYQMFPALMELEGADCIRDLKKYLDRDYGNMLKLVQFFEDQGFVETEKQGRKRSVVLTGRGRRVAVKLKELFEAAEQ